MNRDKIDVTTLEDSKPQFVSIASPLTPDECGASDAGHYFQWEHIPQCHIDGNENGPGKRVYQCAYCGAEGDAPQPDTVNIDIIYQVQNAYKPANGNTFYFWVDCSESIYKEELAEGGIARMLRRVE